MPDPGIAGTGAAEGATGRRAAMPFILITVLHRHGGDRADRAGAAAHRGPFHRQP
jgi:hypothetical protein